MSVNSETNVLISKETPKIIINNTVCFGLFMIKNDRTTIIEPIMIE